VSEYEHNEHLLDEIQRLRESNFYLSKDCNELKQRIKRLEEELNELRSDEAGLLKYNEELERHINRILGAVDKMFPWSECVGQEFWNKAKEAKP
jgi:SMC interacting uncharacterized protein involved in chromosome segregation